MNTEHLAFDLVCPDPKVSARSVVRFRCVECGKRLDLAIPNGRMSPEHEAKRAERHGWKAHSHKRNNVYCPKCAGPQKAPKPVQTAKVIPMNLVPKVASATVAAITQPTPDQRLKIRSHLGKSFDDAVGGYLDGLSDHMIAEMVGVPRIIVEQIREAGWGAIRVDPVIAALRASLQELKGAVAAQEKSHTALVEKISTVEARLNKAAAVG